jgi:hypothetical protein
MQISVDIIMIESGQFLHCLVCQKIKCLNLIRFSPVFTVRYMVKKSCRLLLRKGEGLTECTFFLKCNRACFAKKTKVSILSEGRNTFVYTVEATCVHLLLTFFIVWLSCLSCLTAWSVMVVLLYR